MSSRKSLALKNTSQEHCWPRSGLSITCTHVFQCKKWWKIKKKRKLTVNFKNKTLYRFIELSLLIGGCLSKYHIHLFWAAGWHPYIFIVLCCGEHFPEYRSTEINTPLRKAQPNTTKRLIINWLYCFARHHRRPYRPPISQTKLNWSLIFSSELIS